MFVFLLFFTLGKSTAQTSAISLDKENILYCGLDNPITVVVENLRSKDVILTIENGQLTNAEGNGKYLVRPTKPGTTTITISNRKGKVIAKYQYRAKSIPKADAYLVNKRFGPVQKNELVAQMAVFLKLYGFDINAKIEVTSYKIKIYNKCNIILDEKIDGQYITERVKEKFKLLQKDDIVYIYDVMGKYPNGEMQKSDLPIFLTIE